VSIARKALEHGVNANLLRKWINHYQATARDNQNDALGSALPAFVPVLTAVIQSKTSKAMLTITLVNGVQMTLQAVELSELSRC
jgi:transposase